MPILSNSALRSKQVIGLYHPKTWKEKGLWWTLGLFITTYLLVVLFLGFYWSSTPSLFDVKDNAQQQATALNTKVVTGFTTTATVIHVAETLLDKHGGYLTNDKTLPGLYLDDMPEWEFGVLVQTRDMVRAFRNDFSRSQSQSAEDSDLIVAEPRLNFDSDSWLFPSTESQYRTGIKALNHYLIRLSDNNQTDAQFYARADNLRDWLSQVEKRLGSLSQRLSASVGQQQINTNLAGDRNAQQSTPTPNEVYTKTAWNEVDNIFYETRGQAWALLHFLKAVEIDFGPILDNKNARISLQQIVRELEATQQTVWSPVILSGSGFGFVTNHSLIMASYLSRANAAVIDLRRLLEQG